MPEDLKETERNWKKQQLVSSHSSTSIITFADDTVVLGLINNNDEAAYLDEVRDSRHGARTTVSLWTWAKLKSWL